MLLLRILATPLLWLLELALWVLVGGMLARDLWQRWRRAKARF